MTTTKPGRRWVMIWYPGRRVGASIPGIRAGILQRHARARRRQAGPVAFSEAGATARRAA
jgi:hypothetical protein